MQYAYCFKQRIQIISIAIAYNNIKIHKIKDIDPRRLQSIKNWFKIVKVFDGKKPNHIAYDEKIFNKE
jgi:hypothetical protein